jgi:flagellar motor switch protein FliN/FliY
MTEKGTTMETAALESSIPVRPPEFPDLATTHEARDEAPLDRFYDVSVTVWAELGRVSLSLGELLKLGEGSTVKLDRPISAPVNLVAQGVCFARGEVVVVDDCFAIRIKEIDSSRQLRSVMS